MGIKQNDLYQTYTDNDLAIVLQSFDQDYVYHILETSLRNRLKMATYINPNAVSSFEAQFKNVLVDFPAEQEKINTLRMNTYTRIIEILCNRYELGFNDGDVYDLFTSAMYMYDLLVSGFQRCIIRFFTNYIYSEKEGLYAALNYVEHKDTSYSYNKKVYKDPKLAALSLNIELVVDSICKFDIPFDVYVNLAYKTEGDPSIPAHLISVLTPLNDFFKENVAYLFDTEWRGPLLTNIRMSLQELLPASEFESINIIKQRGE